MSCHLSTVPDFSTTSPATQLEKLSTTVALTRTSTHTVTKNMINALLQAFGKQVGANKQASLQLLYALAAKEGISATREEKHEEGRHNDERCEEERSKESMEEEKPKAEEAAGVGVNLPYKWKGKCKIQSEDEELGILVMSWTSSNSGLKV
jgi:hypothetical protein